MKHSIGKIELILGPMFSGKSTELIKRIRLFKVLNKKIMVVKPNIDNRYSESDISTHDNIKYTSICVTHLSELNTHYADNYKEIDIIVIEEGQFFPDLYDFVIQSANIDFKHVIIAGLSGDYNRKAIGRIIDLIPHADTVEYKTALCTLCGDGTVAPFTFKKIKDTNQILVGGTDIYMPLCRYHYNMKSVE